MHGNMVQNIVIQLLKRKNMVKDMFFETEQRSELLFQSLGPTYCAHTSENHPLIFASGEDFKAGMCILGVCALLHPGVRIYTFELMSNHVHFVLSGETDEIQAFFELFRNRLARHFSSVSFTDFKLQLHPIGDLQYMRNVIAYTNRNAFVVNPDVTPFSYEWGANAFYFRSPLTNSAIKTAIPFKAVELRGFFHSKRTDSIKTLTHIDGVALATSFCDIETGEKMFRDAKHYFYSVSRNIESYPEMAEIMKECAYYTDDDMFLAARKLAKEEYGEENLKLLDAERKFKLAATLKRKYNASDKQLQRLLKVSLG